MCTLIPAVCVLAASSVSAADESGRIVVLTTSRQSYREASEAAVRQLRTSQKHCELIVLATDDVQARLEALERLRGSAPDVIVASGAALTAEALEAIPSVPVVSLMTPNALDAEALRDGSPHRTRTVLVTSDAAPREQVDWIRKTQPECKRIAVLCSANSERTADALRVAGRAANLEITPIHAQRDRFPAAIDALNDGEFDGVLMIPDSQVYNSPNVQRVLLWGLRQKHSVWAFSANVVKAGALAGVYSDPAAVGQRGAEVVEDLLRGKPAATLAVTYPRESAHAVNLRTAEMIGVQFGPNVLASDTTKYGER